MKTRRLTNIGCGLVMKQDITQPNPSDGGTAHGCGLVMKQDITQPTLTTPY